MKNHEEKVKDTIRFLLVDDHSATRNLVKSILFQAGFGNIKTAENGQHAFSSLEIFEIDIVICDWNMPQVTGLELLKKIRSCEKYENLPFIMLTAEHERDQVVTAYAEGVTDYVVKPFTADVLLEKVKRAIKKIKT
jgi:two-component system, chemotaxis family, chemotaxis protein CheY